MGDTNAISAVVTKSDFTDLSISRMFLSTSTDQKSLLSGPDTGLDTGIQIAFTQYITWLQQTAPCWKTHQAGM